MSPGHLIKALRKRLWLVSLSAGGALRWLAERVSRRTYLELEYPPSARSEPRWGHGRPPHPQLAELLEAHRDGFRAQLETIAGYADDLSRIEGQASSQREPSWINGSLPGLDGAAIYSFLREPSPTRYLEVGSGSSTLFAARAKRDGRLPTEVLSIDPHPRFEIDAVCDRIIRAPLEEADLGPFSELRPGDVVFFDGTHRSFMNSDATVFFVEILPRLPPGVLVGIHDIYLPEDYPESDGRRWYSEQYLLGAYLLARAPFVRPVLASWLAARDPSLSQVLLPLWDRPALAGVERHGGAFWFDSAPV